MNIAKELANILPKERIKSRAIDVISYASDAGFYQLIPKAVVFPECEREIKELFQFSKKYNLPLVFRAAGTSLSGQAITDGILVVINAHWKGISIENEGGLVRVQPGITGAMVNAHLKQFHRKIGPDPASINAALMGGILSNNSSGMCCGVKHNSYHTAKFISFVLPNGKSYSTENTSDYERFESESNTLFLKLKVLKERIYSDPELFNKIRGKYQTKNTVGYSLNAFIDFEHPLDILAHLIIGAEGTLAFISEAVLETLPDYLCKSTGLLFFESMLDASKAVPAIEKSGAKMIELMDRAALRAIESMPGVPDIVKSLPDRAAALLVEFQRGNAEALDLEVEAFLKIATGFNLLEFPVFTEDVKERAQLWKIRKGLFPAVGAVRKSGTTVVLEDLAFPVNVLGEAIIDLQQLFERFEYKEAIIFGHAKDGNIHFVITQSFHSEKEIHRYEKFMDEVVALVIRKYNGTLKAEHGTGRNMAPFVETEWGNELYRVMEELKAAVDPEHLLNPGVIVNQDAKAHLKHLKELPTVEEEVDKCIECGYCEHKCPSNDLTTSPRRRIAIQRYLNRKDKDLNIVQKIQEQFDYEVLDTCAVDGSCAVACPVDINTGDLVKRLRLEQQSKFSEFIAEKVAKNFGAMSRLTRTVLNVGSNINKVFGENATHNLTLGARKIVPAFPVWTKQLTKPPKLNVLKEVMNVGETTSEILYFPSCISRTMGSYKGKSKNIMESFLSICEKSSVNVRVVSKVNSTCCSQIFSSKGFKKATEYNANSILELLWEDSAQGSIPIVIDVSSCAYTLKNLGGKLKGENLKKFESLQILDSVEFLHELMLSNSIHINKKKSIALHPVCALEKQGIVDQFEALAQYFSEEVTIPKNTKCCGTAGDRSFMFPELTASATKMEAQEISKKNYDGYYSSTKTCEMSMSEAVEQNYESIIFLVDEGM